MKIAVITVRVLMSLLFLFSAAVVIFKFIPQPEQQGAIKIFMDGVNASVYLMPAIKFFEVLCAISFLTGRYVPLATVVIFPITLNILLTHAFLAPEGLGAGLFLFLGNLFLAYYYRKSYEAFWVAK